MSKHLFSQVDVFSAVPMLGNPVAVVHDAIADEGQEFSVATMQTFARWTNLSETTFVLPPTDPAADYRLRIFTPGGELPFAGHPTLGSCRAWLAVGGVPADADVIVQECAAGLVRIRQTNDQLAFAAPPLVRSGTPEAELRAGVIAACGLRDEQIVDMSWVVNGPNWLGVLLPDAATVLAVEPDFSAMKALGGVEVGLIGPHSEGGPADYEVRAFCPDLGMPEDPVTGSLQAGLAQWLIGAGVAPHSYVAAQGTVLGRAGRVHIEAEHGATGDIWVGGEAVLRIAGAVDLG